MQQGNDGALLSRIQQNAGSLRAALYQQGQGRPVANNVRDEPHTMITTSVRGHLASQDFGPAYGWTRCPPATLFDAPINTEYS
jgi:DNA topoisomerase-3